MKKLKESIEGKPRWVELSKSIELVDENRLDNPNIALDASKTILESIAKTILADKSIDYDSNLNIQHLVKKSFEALPIFSRLQSKDSASAKSIIGSFENITKTIGEFRNRHGFFSHGKDLQSDKFDKYLVELVISSSDLISSFLIISHGEDLKSRTRIYYEENAIFNRYIDDIEDEINVSNITILPSSALFTDEEAYKEKLNAFIDEKTSLIDKVKTEQAISALEELLSFTEYLTEEEEIKLLGNISTTKLVLSDNDDEINEFIVSLYDKRKDILTGEISENIKETIGKKDD